MMTVIDDEDHYDFEDGIQHYSRMIVLKVDKSMMIILAEIWCWQDLLVSNVLILMEYNDDGDDDEEEEEDNDDDSYWIELS